MSPNLHLGMPVAKSVYIPVRSPPSEGRADRNGSRDPIELGPLVWEDQRRLERRLRASDRDRRVAARRRWPLVGRCPAPVGRTGLVARSGFGRVGARCRHLALARPFRSDCLSYPEVQLRSAIQPMNGRRSSGRRTSTPVRVWPSGLRASMMRSPSAAPPFDFTSGVVVGRAGARCATASVSLESPSPWRD